MVLPAFWNGRNRPRGLARGRRRASASPRRPHRDVLALACEELERRALLAVNVFNVSGSSISGTVSVDTTTGVVSGLNVSPSGWRTFTTGNITSQAASGSPLSYRVIAVNSTQTISMSWNLPTGALSTYTGGSFNYTLQNANTGVFIPSNSGVLTLAATPNRTPTDISVSASSVTENSVVGTVVGTLSTTDPDAGNTFTYTLVTGTGATDNASFTIVGNELRAAAVFDFESKPSYSVRIRTTDQGGLSFEEPFTITVTNVNESPTDIQISSTTIPENSPIGTVVGTLSTTDPDAGNTFTYALVTGTGATDNASFTIVGNELRSAATFDFEAKPSYSVRIRTTDQGGQAFEEPFTISVTNVNETFGAGAWGWAGAIVPDNAKVKAVASDSSGNIYVTGEFSGSPDFDMGVGTAIRSSNNADGFVAKYSSAGALQWIAQISGTAEQYPTDIAVDASGNVLVCGYFSGATTFGTGLSTTTSTSPLGHDGFVLKLNSLGQSQWVKTFGGGYGCRLTSIVTDSTGAVTVVGGFRDSTIDFDPGAGTAILTATTRDSVVVKLDASGNYAWSGRFLGGEATDVAADGSGSILVTGYYQYTVDFDPGPGVATLTHNQGQGAYAVKLSSSGGYLWARSIGNIDWSRVPSCTFDTAGNAFVAGQFSGAVDFDPTLAVDSRSASGTTWDAFVTKYSGGGDYLWTQQISGPGDESVESVATNSLGEVFLAGKFTDQVDADPGAGVATLTSAGGTDVLFVQLSPAGAYRSSKRYGGIAADYATGVVVGGSGSAVVVGQFNDAIIAAPVEFGANPGDAPLVGGDVPAFILSLQNWAPADIALSASSMAENQSVGTTVGTLSTSDPNAGDTFTYTLVSGTGSADNASFTIVGNELRAAAAFNFEAKPTYSVRIRTTDQGNLTFEKVVTISITNVDESPADIQISGTTIAENSPVGTVVGTLSAVDPEAGPVTYSLVSGAGATDNAWFQIVGNQLRSAAVFNFEAKQSYAIRIQATDAGGLSTPAMLEVRITNVNEGPTGIFLTGGAVAENSSVGTVVGIFSAVDPDQGENFIYSLAAGEGAANNGSFQIVNNELRTAGPLNHEATGTLTIRVQATDSGGQSLAESFTIAITNVNEAPTDVQLSGTTIAENSPIGAAVGTLSTTDPDAGNTFAYSLVSGTGSTDNASFTIVGDELRSAVSLDFEAKPTYSVRIRTTDQGGLSFEEAVTISVTDVSDPVNVFTIAGTWKQGLSAPGPLSGQLSIDPATARVTALSLLRQGGIQDNTGVISNGQLIGGTPLPDTTYDTASIVSQGIVGGNYELRTAVRGSYQMTMTWAIPTGSLGTFSGGPVSFDFRTIQQFAASNPGSGTLTLLASSNASPTDIQITGTTIAENSPIGTVVGTLSTTDPDAGNTFTYALVTGTGSADNASFTIVGNQLRSAATFDFEAKPSYSVRIRTTDQGGLSFEEPFTISVTNVNESPTDIQISSTTIAENSPIGTVMGTLSTTDPDAGNTFTYTLVTGTGSTDNASFTIVGNQLRSAAAFDFEAKPSYSLRIRTTDQGGLSFEKPFTISVTNVNESPTDIQISSTTIAENSPIGTVMGTLSTTDPDAGNTFTYTLVSGTGSTDNASFTIVGNQLRSAAAFDFEAKPSYSVRICTTDQSGLSFEKAFTISVTNVNESPTDIRISSTTIAENSPIGTVVGTIWPIDPDAGNTVTYTLVPGTGSTDNASFTIVGNELRAAATFDFEAKPSYSVRIRATDQGNLTFEKVFAITVTNVNEPPIDPRISGNTIAENSPIGTLVGTLSAVDPEAGPVTYSLVSGAGATDNAWFQIVGNQLRSAAVFNFEAKQRYSIRIQATDGGGVSTPATLEVLIANVNEAPTGIVLAGDTVTENSLAGTIVGIFNAIDPDQGENFLYSFAAGDGSDGNGSFQIVNNELRTAGPLNHEATPTLTIRVQVTDAAGNTFADSFTISVMNVNEPPTGIQSSGTTVAENSPIGTVVGTLSTTDPDAGDTFTYALVDGTGSTDNASFTIVGNQLRSAAVFDFEARRSYSVRIRSTDQGGLSIEIPLTITVGDVFEVDGVRLTPAAIAENSPVGTAAGTLFVTGPNAGASFTYSLVAGSGSADNSLFQVVGNQLRSRAVFDFETRPAYTVRIRATAQGGQSIETAIPVAVVDLNEHPTDIQLSPRTIAEDSPLGTVVGTLSTTDPDAVKAFTYTLVPGTGSTDNASFTIVGNELRAAAVFDFEAKRIYSVRIRTTDQGNLTFEKPFTIDVTDMPEQTVPPWFLPNFPDQPLREEAWSRYTDRSLDRNEMIDLIRSVARDGLSAAELAGLRRIVAEKVGGAFEVTMPNYVRNLADKVLNLHAANGYFRGRPLGSLTADATSLHVEKLLTKWFYGGDHPDTRGTLADEHGFDYGQAAGQLFVGGPSFADVVQGRLSTCYLLAMAGGVADRYTVSIEQMFIDNGDDSWTVRFFVWQKDANGSPTRFEDYVTVDRYLPHDLNRLVFAGGGRSRTDPTNELWVPLLEKAYAQWAETPGTVTPWVRPDWVQGQWMEKAPRNAYRATEVGQPDKAVAHILGTAPRTRFPADSWGFSLEDKGLLEAALALQQVVALGSMLHPSPTLNEVLPGHQYVVTSNFSEGYGLIQPYPDAKGIPRELVLTWDQWRQGNFQQLVIADANRSLGDEGLLVPTPRFGASLVAVGDASLPPPPAIDLNGDGITDTLWRDPVTGAVTGRVQDGNGNVIATRKLGGDLNWSIVATGHFDTDDVTDFVWADASTGQHILRTGRIQGRIQPPTGQAGAGWEVVMAGDFDGDRRSDLVWRNRETGEHSLALMDGLTVRQLHSLRAGGERTLVPTAPDFDQNGDGRSDLVWRDSRTGANTLDLMAGGSVISTRALGGDLDWVVVAAADFDGNRSGDLLWRQTSTGVISRGRPQLESSPTPIQWAAVALVNLDGNPGVDTVWSRTARGVSALSLVRTVGVRQAVAVNTAVNWSLVRSPWAIGDDGVA
jgi:mRNA-degrading endonuclease HigB of HigAB toxin-antitoxin module